jgi:hypothetical protein
MKNSHRSLYEFIGAAILVVIIVLGAFTVLHHKQKTPSISNNLCIGQQLSVGSKGTCVSDVQTMVNFMETDNLTQCPFPGNSRLGETGTYDATTQAQVKVIQTWINCYDDQEGQSAGITPNGIVTTNTWSVLCSYAYRFPKQSASTTSPYASQSSAAGANAGCDKLS